MNYYNDIEERLAQQYLTLGVGTNKICTDCHQDSNLSMPIGCWCVGSNFNNHQKRILFVGKNPEVILAQLKIIFVIPFNMLVTSYGTNAGHIGAIPALFRKKYSRMILLRTLLLPI